MKEVILIPLLFLSFQLYAQQEKPVKNFWHSKDAYFGQKPPGDIPQIFAPGILVDSGIVLGRVSFSANGKQFYYTRSEGWFSSKGARVQRLVFENGNWQKSQILFEDLTNPALTPDGTTLYFGAKGSTVVQSDWIAGQWSQPRVAFNQSFGLYNFQPTNNKKVFYAGSNGKAGKRDDYSTFDFCKMTLFETDTSIESLGTAINTPGFDGDFYIAPDESYIIISAKETPTYECELWISFRNKDGSWAAPLSLGAAINDGLAHRFGQYVTPDGKYLIYTRGTSEKDCNFYWVRFDQLKEKLRIQSQQ